jgi:thioredoxin 1
VKIKIIDVWAEWCAPCKKFTPIFHALEEKYPDIEFVKVNVDEDSSLLREFNIRGIPAIIFLVDGSVVRTHIGILSMGQMEQHISDLLYGESVYTN